MKFLLVLSLLLALYLCQQQVEECKAREPVNGRGFFYQPGWGCQQCFANCKVCNSYHTCEECISPHRVIQTCSCKPGLVEVNGICTNPFGLELSDEENTTTEPQITEPEPDTTQTEDEQDGPEDCLSNEFWDEISQLCIQCFENCEKCENLESCQKCKGINRLLDENCSCYPGFASDEDGNCYNPHPPVEGICELGQYYSHSSYQCEQCPENCANCTQLFCIQCFGPRRAVSESCNCIAGWIENGNGRCVVDRSLPTPIPNDNNQCPDGYFSKNNQCKQCYRGCTKCTAKYECQECVDTFYRVKDNSCFCAYGYFDLNGTCQQPLCQLGQFPKINNNKNRFMCKDCLENCRRCNQQDSCLECLDGYYYLDGQCLEIEV